MTNAELINCIKDLRIAADRQLADASQYSPRSAEAAIRHAIADGYEDAIVYYQCQLTPDEAGV